MTRKAIGKQLAYLRRDLDAIDSKLSLGKNLPPRQAERLDTIRTVYEQQKYMYDNPSEPALCSAHCAGKSGKAGGVWREAGHQCR